MFKSRDDFCYLLVLDSAIVKDCNWISAFVINISKKILNLWKKNADDEIKSFSLWTNFGLKVFFVFKIWFFVFWTRMSKLKKNWSGKIVNCPYYFKLKVNSTDESLNSSIVADMNSYSRVDIRWVIGFYKTLFTKTCLWAQFVFKTYRVCRRFSLYIF